MKLGEVLSVQYSFLNIGMDSLQVEIVSACDCMELAWTLDPVPPNRRGTVDILFDTANQPAEIIKDIDVIFKNTDARGYPLVKRVILKGRVE
jgi:hypothetical protein